MDPGRGQTSVLNYEDRANPSTPPAYEFHLLVYVPDGIQQNVSCLKGLLGNQLQPFSKEPRVLNITAFFKLQLTRPSDTIVIQL